MDKNDLVRRRLPEDKIDIAGVGTIRFRSLSRAESMSIRSDDTSKFEVKLLAAAMLDPELTEADAEEWTQAATPDEIRQVSDAILILSGMVAGADKESYKSVRGKSRA